MHDYSKVLEKFFETINTFFGGNYKARAILSEGKAKAEVTELQAQADAKTTLIRGMRKLNYIKKFSMCKQSE